MATLTQSAGRLCAGYLLVLKQAEVAVLSSWLAANRRHQDHLPLLTLKLLHRANLTHSEVQLVNRRARKLLAAPGHKGAPED